jgi:hypothetical protein
MAADTESLERALKLLGLDWILRRHRLLGSSSVVDRRLLRWD